jgi:protein SDA1
VCLNYLIRIMIAALLFLLDYEKIEDDDDDDDNDSDASSSKDDSTPQKPQDLLSKVNCLFCVWGL